MSRNLAVSDAFIAECESEAWFDSAGAVRKTLKVYCKFNGTDWTEITDYVEGVTIHGAIGNMSGQPGPMTCSIELQNKDRRFSDLWTSSEYYGQLRPNKQVKVELTITSETAVMFTGRVDENGWQEDRAGNDGMAHISCIDDAGKLETKLFPKDVVVVGKALAATSEVDSVLKDVLTLYGGMATSDIIVNGLVDVTVPYAQFRSGQSVWSAVQSIAKASLASYCGFGTDGKLYFDSRLVSGWVEPSSEYEVSSADLGMDLVKSTVPMSGNNVKVRGSHLELNTSEATVLWSLRNVKQVGKNAIFPTYCWEVVATGDYFLCDPTADPPVEYFAKYEVKGAEIVYTDNHTITQKTFEGTATSQTLRTASSELDYSPTQGKLVLLNDGASPVTMMDLEIRGNAVLRRTVANRYSDSGGKLNEEAFNPMRALGFADDDLRWGRVAVAVDASSETEYGEKWLIVSDDLIVENVQMAQIADYWLKRGAGPRHSFSLSRLPLLAFLQAGAIITLVIAELGLSMACEVTSYTHDIKQGQVSTTLNVEEQTAWTQTSESVSGVWLISAGAGDFGTGVPGSSTLVTIAASDHEEVTDYKCDGSDDEDLLQWIANNLASEFGGGTMELTEGTFVLGSSVAVPTGVWIRGRGSATVVDRGGGVAFVYAGSSATHVSGVALADLQLDDGRVYATYVDGLHVQNVLFANEAAQSILASSCTEVSVIGSRFDDCLSGIELHDCTGMIEGNSFTGAMGGYAGPVLVTGYGVYCRLGTVSVQGNMFTDITTAGAFYGVSLVGSEDCVVAENQFVRITSGWYDTASFEAVSLTGSPCRNKITGNRVSDCYGWGALQAVIDITDRSDKGNAVGLNYCEDNGNLINHGECEDEPLLEGEAAGSPSGVTIATGAFQTGYRNHGVKMTKTAAAGTLGVWDIADGTATDDLHGLVAGGTYLIGAWVLIPSSMTYSGVQLGVRYYTPSSWTFSSEVALESYDTWQWIEKVVTIPASATAAHPRVEIATSASSSEYIRVDEIVLRPYGIHNEHGQQFADGGLKTAEVGNSWQNPFGS